MCLKPLRASISDEKPHIRFHYDGEVKLPCGKCMECKKLYAMEWAKRVEHELSLHDEACFITLTYAEEYLPPDSEKKKHYQKFMKRLRKRTKKKLLSLVSHEYGSKEARLHHHMIIFGYSPKDQKLFTKTPKGHNLYTAQEITELWPYGHHTIAEANGKTAYYIASYAVKKRQKSLIDKTTGEFKEFIDTLDSSKAPAVGWNYLKKFYKQIFQSEQLIPRYYKRKAKEYLNLLEELKKLNPAEENELKKIKKITAQLPLRKKIFEEYISYEQNLDIQDRPLVNKYAKIIISQKPDYDTQYRDNDTTTEETRHIQQQFKQELEYLSTLGGKK